MESAGHAAVMRQLGWRITAFLALANLLSGIDRFNVSVAALTMNGDLRLSATAFGVGVGAFFWTYVLAQIPVSLLLRRFGPSRCIGVIMILWGLCASTMALIRTENQFILIRAALGAAEAGFFPAVLLLAARWIPETHRGRFLAVFAAAGVAATVVGPPLAANLMRLNGMLGLAGWRWLFLLEGAPALALGIAAPFVLTDSPAAASWLTEPGRSWLVHTLASEGSNRPAEPFRFKQLLRPELLLLALISFTIESAAYTVAYWMPLVIKAMGLTNLQVGYAASAPGAVGCLAMILWARSSDRTGERRVHLALAMVIGGVGMAATGLFLGNAVWAMAALCVAAAGIVSTTPVLWSMPARIFSPASLALAVALIGAVGNSGGFVAPPLVGLLVDVTHSFKIALIAAGAPMLAAALLVGFIGLRRPAGSTPLATIPIDLEAL
jgi:ACS family tartrate transporter-like MFS transporter